MSRSARGQRLAFGVALLTLVAGTAGFHVARSYLDVVLTKEAVPLRQALRELPKQVGRWQRFGVDDTLSLEMMEELGTDQYLSRSYALEGDPSNGVLALHIAYYTGIIDAVPHIPERCFGASGYERAPSLMTIPVEIDRSDWIPDLESASNPGTPDYMSALSRDGRRVRMPLIPEDELRLNATEYWRPESPDQKIAAGYFFIANGKTTAMAAGVRSLAFRPQDQHAYYCKVQLTYGRPDHSVTREELAAVAGEFLSDLLPELMRALPDWYEVELSDEGAVSDESRAKAADAGSG